MNAVVLDGLRVALSEFLRTGVWIFIGVIPFWNNLRVKKRTMIILMVLASFFLCFSAFYLRVFSSAEFMVMRQYRLYLEQVYRLIVIVIFIAGVKAFWGKIIYVFLFIYTISSFIKFAALFAVQLFNGFGTPVGLQITPALRYIAIALNLVSMPFLARFCKTRLRDMLEKLSKADTLAMCIIPAMFAMLITIETAAGVKWSVETYLWVAVMLFTNISAVLSFFMNVIIVRSNYRRAHAEAQLEAVGSTLSLQQRGYAQLTDSIFKATAMRHDIRFHLAAIAGFSKNKEYEKLDEYLEEYSRGFEDGAIDRISTHQTIDVLARYYVNTMQEYGVKTDALLPLPQEWDIADTDLCVVFGNLLENAANELKGQSGGFFYARCRAEGGKLVITMRNACKEKSKKIVRGIGLESVAAVAQKYNGDIKCTAEDGVFTADVLMFYNSDSAE